MKTLYAAKTIAVGVHPTAHFLGMTFDTDIIASTLLLSPYPPCAIIPKTYLRWRNIFPSVTPGIATGMWLAFPTKLWPV